MEIGTILEWKDMEIGGIYKLFNLDGKTESLTSPIFIAYGADSFDNNVKRKRIISLKQDSLGFIWWESLNTILDSIFKGISEFSNYKCQYLGQMPSFE